MQNGPRVWLGARLLEHALRENIDTDDETARRVKNRTGTIRPSSEPFLNLWLPKGNFVLLECFRRGKKSGVHRNLDKWQNSFVQLDWPGVILELAFQTYRLKMVGTLKQ